MGLDKKKLLETIENAVKNTLFESTVIKMVEERGMFSDYRGIINPILNYVDNYLDNNNPNENVTITSENGTVKADKYTVEIPQNLLNKISWVEEKKIVIEVLDLTEDGVKKIGLNNIIDHKSGQYNLSRFDRLTPNNKLEKIEIKISGFSVNKNIFQENIQSSLYHEFTHAFENYNKLKNKGSKSFKDLINTNYVDVSDYKKDGSYFKYINYYLLNQTELSANIAGTYGDLERINSIRKNYAIDIK